MLHMDAKCKRGMQTRNPNAKTHIDVNANVINARGDAIANVIPNAIPNAIQLHLALARIHWH